MSPIASKDLVFEGSVQVFTITYLLMISFSEKSKTGRVQVRRPPQNGSGNLPPQNGSGNCQEMIQSKMSISEKARYYLMFVTFIKTTFQAYLFSLKCSP